MNFEPMLLVISALAGVLLGGGGVFAVLARANRSLALKDSTERLLAEQVPPHTVAQLNHIANRMLDIVEQGVLPAVQFVESVTDDEPNA